MEDEYVTSDPDLHCGGGASSLFSLHWSSSSTIGLVERRQKKVMSTAVQSSAIVFVAFPS
jgi:hypothetical protein